MLRACVLTYGKRWEKFLPFVEFSYNNSYQASIKMAPFEALYGRRCRTPLNWFKSGERPFYGPDMIIEAEAQVKQIREHLRVAQSRQKSYADRRRCELVFEVGNFVYLKVTQFKGTRRFQVKGKLAPRYVGPFRIIERRGSVAYQLELPPSMSSIHDVFHISQLKKCLRVPTEATSVEELELQPDLSYTEQPIRILGEAEHQLRNRTIKMVKVQWSDHTEDEATWERDDQIRTDYPELFTQG